MLFHGFSTAEEKTSGITACTQCLCSDASTSFFVKDVSPSLGITHRALQSPQTQTGSLWEFGYETTIPPKLLTAPFSLP